MSAATTDKVVRQMEFYFSDSNLPRDRFLLERVHENPEGFVDIGLVATFARMREILNVRAPAAQRLRRHARLRCSVLAPRVRAAHRWARAAGAGARATLTLKAAACCLHRCTLRALRPRRWQPSPTCCARARRRCKVRHAAGVAARAVAHACAAVSEDGKRVRRAVALEPGAEEDIIKAVEARSLYATPFPMDSTLDGARRLAARCGGG